MIRFLTAGESHGPMLTTIVEGMPAGLELSAEDINTELARRQKGYGKGGRMYIETDVIHITSGVMNGKTTGGPIAMYLINKDYAKWEDKDIKPITTPRPGHADLTGAIKYGYRELRLSLERASARETAMRVAVGAIARKYLVAFGIKIGGYVTQIGDVTWDVDRDADPLQLFDAAEASDVRCPDEAVGKVMRKTIRETQMAKDTLGGVFEVIALGVPPGLGSHVHYDRKLDARIVGAMVSIQAMKGAEIGEGFANAGKRGSEVHDEIILHDDGSLGRATNRAGGLEGGISTGDPIVVRVAMKPISTVLKALNSVNLATGEPEPTTYERSDICALPRAVPIGEAMLAIVLADAMMEKLGGDSMDEMCDRFERLRRAKLDDLPMDNTEWRFGFE